MTPVGVRDGDPDALAGLCDRRGPAVLAYCQVVAGREQAVAAAAEAFARFRAGVAAAGDLTSVNPEAMLISATRHSAARHCANAAPHPCAQVPALLAARADRSITLADHDWLEQHLPGCWTCRAPAARFEAADRAYIDPPATPLAPEASAAMVAAMTAAAPVRGADPPPPPPPPQLAVPDRYSAPQEDAHAVSTNGATAHGGDALAPAYVDQPTAAWQIGVDDVDVYAEPAEQDPPATAFDPYDPSSAKQRRARGRRLPRERRAKPAAAATRSESHGFRLSLVLPIAFVVVAIVVALLIAGVFGGREGASTPQSFTPGSSTPTQPDPASIVAVPGAQNASAAAVERAKAKRRAASQPTTTSGDGSDTASTPATSPTPAPAATTPPATSTAADKPAGKDDASGKKPSGGDSSSNKPTDGGSTPSTTPQPGAGDQAAPSSPSSPPDPTTGPDLGVPSPPPVPRG